jgi:hypothetical protein
MAVATEYDLALEYYLEGCPTRSKEEFDKSFAYYGWNFVMYYYKLYIEERDYIPAI